MDNSTTTANPTAKPGVKRFVIEVLGKDVNFELDANDARQLAHFAAKEANQSMHDAQRLVISWVQHPETQTWLLEEFGKFENAVLADGILATIGQEIAPILQKTSLVKLKTSSSPK